MVSLGKDVADKAVSEKTTKKDDSGSEIHVPQQNPNNGVSPLQSDQKKSPESVIPEKASQVCDSPVPALQSNQEGSVSSLTTEKASQTPETTALALQSGLERSTSSRVREKGLEDGYNWRKYGQKLVRGNLYVRSYYRCTHPKCPVKRQVERTHDGQVTDTVYFGQHEHPEPQLSVPVAVGFALSIVEAEEPLPCVEDKSSDAHGNTSKQIEPVGPVQLSNVTHTEDVQGVLSKSKGTKDGEPDPKRQKKEKHNGKSIPIDKRTGEPRLVVQTMSEVDIVNDGYRWRKYGQKMVKGNPNPRSYYRCSHPGCPVKKHVERAFNDSKVVIATYEGQHDHDVPPARTVIHNAAAPNVLMISQNGESGTKSQEDVGCRSIVPSISPKHEDMVVNSDMGPERKLDEKLIGKACAKAEEGDTPGMIVCRADKLQNGESESKSLEPEKPKTKAEPIQG